MAGLGRDIRRNFFLRAMCNAGTIDLGGMTFVPWFFSEALATVGGFMGDRSIPSIHLEYVEGTPCTVGFENQSAMDHTIHLHGLDVDQANDGVGVTSFVVPPMGSTTYAFTAPHAGTYHYHCHVDTTIHYARGMYGTIIVRPPDGSTSVAWAGGPAFQEEVLWHLATFDTDWMALTTTGPQTARFHPNVFTLNGFETPAARVDPYTRIVATVGQKVYLRIMQCAYNWARVSFGGLPFEVIDSDGRPMRTPYSATELEIGPGERYGLLLTANAVGNHIALVEYLNEYNDSVRGSVQTEVQFV